MNRKFMNFTSVSLALLMSVSCIAPYMPTNVYASDSVQVSTTGETETSSDTIQVETTEKTVQSSVSIEEAADSNIVVDNTDGYSAGDTIPLHVKASNTGTEDVKFRVYFWDYDKELPKEKSSWSEKLKDACKDVQVTEFKEKNTISVKLAKDKDTKQVDATLAQESDEKSKEVTSRYISLTLPAGTSLDTVFHLKSDVAETVTVVPAMVSGSEDDFGDAVQAKWQKKDIVVESDEKNEDSSNDIVIGTSDIDFEPVSEETKDADIEVSETEETKSEEATSEKSESETTTGESETEAADTTVDISKDIEKVEDASENTNSEEVKESESEAEKDSEASSDVEETTESETNSDVKTDTDSDVKIETDASSSEEHFLDKTDGVEDLNTSDFTSARLVVLADDESVIVDKEHLIGSYDSLYLLQYQSFEQAMNAYVYYQTHAVAVEPDMTLDAADNEDVTGTGEAELSVTEDVNPISSLENEDDSEVAQKADKVIALIDTGASESSNVIDRVSLIDDVMAGNGHGDKMVEAIASQDADAKILSIRTMGNDGRGTVSSIVAGMEYAINQKVSIINLSMYAKSNLSNSVIASEIQKAVDAGIEVVGAAGNDGADVKDYMPGSVDVAWIIGAADKTGSRLNTSNYGDTVDYNVIADSTSEAAAKFSGYISENGTDTITVNEGVIYTTDYVPSSENPDTGDKDTDDKKTDADNGIEIVPGEDDEIESIDGYPDANSTTAVTVNVWTKDKWYDFKSYNPYGDAADVECMTEDFGELSYKAGDTFEGDYVYSLKEKPEYKWGLSVTFTFVDDRGMTSIVSDKANNILPDVVNQERNAGYTGIVPEFANETVDGGKYTAILGDKDFTLEGLLLPYNPNTFKVNEITDEGGFDINTVGSYTVTYKMSYFMYFEYTWYVKVQVDVVDPATLEPGLYLTSRESTLSLTRKSDGQYGGYGNLFKLADNENVFTVSCIDKDYELGVVSSNDAVSTDEICSVVDNEDGTKELSVKLPENLPDGATILSVERPGYVSAKSFMGGGWKTQDYTEGELDGMTEKEFNKYEDAVSGESDENPDEYMNTAAGWTIVDTKNVSATLRSGSANVTNYGWDYNFAGANYGTVEATKVAQQIVNAVHNIDSKCNIQTSQVKNFEFNCASGHDFLALPANTPYTCTIKVQLQKNGDSYRVKLYTSFSLPQDSHGNYQSFYGSTYINNVDTGIEFRVYKRLAGNGFSNSTVRIGQLSTTFGIYNDANCTDLEAAVRITVPDEENLSSYARVNLDPGRYWVKETRRIGGCVYNEDVYPIKLDKDTKSPAKLKDVLYGKKPEDFPSLTNDNTNSYVYNKPFTFTGELFRKLCGTNKDNATPVEGAVFKVEYSSDAEDTKVAGDAFAKADTHYTWYFETDKDGKVKYDDAHLLKTWTDPSTNKKYTSDDLIMYYTTPALPIGYLRAKEVYAPAKYERNNNTFYFRIIAVKDEHDQYSLQRGRIEYDEYQNKEWKKNWDTKGGDYWTEQVKDVVNNNPGVNRGCIFNKLRNIKVTVEKGSKAPTDIMNLSAYSLEGGKFEVWTAKTGGNKVTMYKDEANTQPVTQLVTNKDGKTPTYYIPVTKTTTYWVREVVAIPGHEIQDPISFTVTIPADAGKTKTVKFTDDKADMFTYTNVDAVVEKLSSKGWAVPGVVFKAQLYDGDKADSSKLKKTWYLKSDEYGKVYFDRDHRLATWTDPTTKKSYTSDSFYTFENKIIIPIGCYVTIQEVEAPATYTIDDKVYSWNTEGKQMKVQRIYNKLTPSTIHIKKYDAKGKKVLSGIEFRLTFVKQSETYTDNALKTYTPLLKEGASVTAKTDSNGEISWSNLDQGEYQITEVKTENGKTVLKEPIKVTLPITMTDAEVKTYKADTSKGKKDTDYSGKWYFYEATYEVTNDYTFILPQTGGMGIWKYGFIGVGIMGILAGGLFAYDSLNRKRRRRRA